MSEPSARQTGPVRRERIGVVALLTASGLSGLGDMVAAIALPWFVLQETGSPALTALTGFAPLVSLVVGGIVGGAVVDRFGFRPVSIVADLASGATIALIPILALRPAGAGSARGAAPGPIDRRGRDDPAHHPPGRPAAGGPPHRADRADRRHLGRRRELRPSRQRS